jgi:hypothetical protein
MKILRILLLLIILGLPSYIYAQDKGDSKSSAPTSRAQRMADKKKWKEQRLKAHQDKKMVKQHHKMLQTKKVQKRMKKNKRKAERINDNKREFFLKRWFGRS